MTIKQPWGDDRLLLSGNYIGCVTTTNADYIVGLERALRQIADIPNKLDGGDWDEIEEARAIASAALEDPAIPGTPHRLTRENG